jgi:hypothetical protein
LIELGPELLTSFVGQRQPRRLGTDAPRSTHFIPEQQRRRFTKVFAGRFGDTRANRKPLRSTTGMVHPVFVVAKVGDGLLEVLANSSAQLGAA